MAVRNIRRHARKELEALEKDGDISKDDLDRAEKDLEKPPTRSSPRSTRWSNTRSESCSRSTTADPSRFRRESVQPERAWTSRTAAVGLALVERKVAEDRVPEFDGSDVP